MEYDTEIEIGTESGVESARDAGRDTGREASVSSSSLTEHEEKPSLLHEWSLFWDSLKRDRHQAASDLDQKQSEMMSLGQAKDLIRTLSQERRKMNQKIESINKEIGLNSSKLESVRLAGASEEAIIKRMNELNDQGQKLSHELASLDEKLRRARDFEGGLTHLILE